MAKIDEIPTRIVTSFIMIVFEEKYYFQSIRNYISQQWKLNIHRLFCSLPRRFLFFEFFHSHCEDQLTTRLHMLLQIYKFDIHLHGDYYSQILQISFSSYTKIFHCLSIQLYEIDIFVRCSLVVQ